MRKYAVVTVCLVFLSASFSYAEFYRWVDNDGREFYTNDRETVPQENRSSISAMNPDERRVSVGSARVSPGRLSAPRNGQKDKNGRGEDYWHRRAEKLRKDLALLQERYDVFLKREKEEENNHGSFSVSAVAKKKKSRSRRESQKAALERDLSRKKHELEVELPEEARKAEAYPGWLRE